MRAQSALDNRDTPGNGYLNTAIRFSLDSEANVLQAQIVGHDPSAELAVAGHIVASTWNGLLDLSKDPIQPYLPQIASARAALARDPNNAQKRQAYAALLRTAWQKHFQWEAAQTSPGGPLTQDFVTSTVSGIAGDFANLWGGGMKCVKTQVEWDCADALIKVPMPALDAATAWNVGGLVRGGVRAGAEQGGRVLARETVEALAADGGAADQATARAAAAIPRDAPAPVLTGDARTFPGAPGRLLAEHVDYPSKLEPGRPVLLNGKLGRVVEHSPSTHDLLFDPIPDASALPAAEQAQARELKARAEAANAWRRPGAWKAADLADDGHAHFTRVLEKYADAKPTFPRHALPATVAGEPFETGILGRSIDALSDRARFAAWAKDLKTEVLLQMQADNVAFDEKTFERRLMKTAHRRFIKAGFPAHPDGVVDFAGAHLKVRDGFAEAEGILSKDSFMDGISRGYIPLDLELPEQSYVFSVHGPISHLLQNLYLSDTVEGFSRLYPQLGAATSLTTEKGEARHVWDVLLEGKYERNLGNPGVLQTSICGYFYIMPCPKSIEWFDH